MNNFVKYDLESIKEAHLFSSRNKQFWMESVNCGCFYCLKIFKASEITAFVSYDDTLISPYCGIDSVIPDKSGIVLSYDFLLAMKKYWF